MGVDDDELRRRALEELLRRFPETMPAWGSGGGGDGSGVFEMPAVYHAPPVRELRRCLGLLERADELAYRHVRGRFLHGERKPWRCRQRAGRLEGLPLRHDVVGLPVAVRGETRHGYQLVTVVAFEIPRWVRDEHVARGVGLLLEWFRGEPELPREFVAR